MFDCVAGFGRSASASDGGGGTSGSSSMDDAPDDAEPALSMVGTTARVLSGVATTSALVVAGAASSDAAPIAGDGDDDGAAPSDTTVALVQRLAERQKELDAVSAAAQ